MKNKILAALAALLIPMFAWATPEAYGAFVSVRTGIGMEIKAVLKTVAARLRAADSTAARSNWVPPMTMPSAPAPAPVVA